MYSIYIRNGSTEVCIYNDAFISDDRQVSSPKLELTESSAGTLSFKLPPTNAGYDIIERLSTEIMVRRKGIEIWSGRVLTIKEDFYKNRNYTCEGELAYLNDTTQPQNPYENITVYSFLQTLLAVHNRLVGSNKQFTIGAISQDPYTVIDETYTNYENTLKCISDKLINLFGGYLKVRKVNGVRYLDYIAEENRPTCPQEIRFGSNLLDFTKSFDSTDFCTVVIPLGDRITNEYGISTSGIEGVEEYTTVEDADQGDGSIYIGNAETIARFGRIEKVVNFSGVSDPGELYELGLLYLSSTQFDDITLEVSAVDLSYMDVDVSQIELSQKVRVISRPHGLDTYFPVKKISIPLDNPANTTFTLGNNIKNSLTVKTNTDTSNLSEIIKNTPTESEILINARKNANAIINSFTTGYITITQDDNGSNELFITDYKGTSKDKDDILANSTRYWRWNLEGLGYYNKSNPDIGNDNYQGTGGLRMALTMDGAIVADYITAGTLTANVVKTGILQALNGGSYWNLDTGELYLTANTKMGSSNTTLSDLNTTINATAEGLSAEVNARTNLGTNLQSQITQNAEAITSKVSSGDVESIIEQNADSIRLKSSNLIVESDHFTLDKYGNMECSNASISGTITVGGRSNQNGRIYVKNSSGNTKLTISNEGITGNNLEFTENQLKYENAIFTSDGFSFGDDFYFNNRGTIRAHEFDVVNGNIYLVKDGVGYSGRDTTFYDRDGNQITVKCGIIV